MDTATIHFHGVLKPAHEGRAKVLFDLELQGALSTGHSANVERLADASAPTVKLEAATTFSISSTAILELIQDYYLDAAPYLPSSGPDVSAYCEYPISRAITLTERASRP